MRHPSPRQGVAQKADSGTAQVFYFVVFKIWLAAVTEYVRNRANLETARRPRMAVRKTAGVPPAVSFPFFAAGSAEQLQHALLRLVGKRQRGDRDRLAGRQRLAVGRFLVGVGQRQVRGAGLQHVDQVLREVLADLHDRQVRTEVRGFRAQRGGDVGERGQRLVRRRAVQEVGTGGQGRQTKTRGVEGDALDRQRGLAGFVEGQVQRIAFEQVDAVERGVL